jgi:hypothetical protein
VIKGYLKGEMREPVSAKSKTMRGRYRLYPSGLLDDIESHRAELIEISMKSWPVLLAKIKQKKEQRVLSHSFLARLHAQCGTPKVAHANLVELSSRWRPSRDTYPSKKVRAQLLWGKRRNRET